MLIIYLDTNHISHIAKHPGHPDSAGVLGLLENDAYCLGISLLHLQELSAPTFASRYAVGRLLDTAPVWWAPSPDEVFQREVRWGIERALYGATSPRQVFHVSFEHAMGAPPGATIPISGMLDAMAGHPELRVHLRDAARYGAHADSAFKRMAAIVRNPDEPILSHIRDMRLSSSQTGFVIPQDISDEEILRRAGGLASFPANNVAQALARVRSRDETFRTSENDLVDEWHACYAPYCTAIILDRSTAARFRIAGLPEANRVTHRLGDLPDILRNPSAF